MLLTGVMWAFTLRDNVHGDWLAYGALALDRPGAVRGTPLSAAERTR
jgi:hypothetical protein